MSRTIPGILRRGLVFYFRQAIPKDLHQTLARREISFSLKTSDLRVAHRRSRRAMVSCDEYFERIKKASLLTQAQVNQWINDLRDQILEIDNVSRIRGAVDWEHVTPVPLPATNTEEDLIAFVERLKGAPAVLGEPLSEQERRFELKRTRATRKRMQLDLARGDFTEGEVGAQIVMLNEGQRFDGIELRQLEQAVLRARIEALKAIERRLKGDYGNHSGQRHVNEPASIASPVNALVRRASKVSPGALLSRRAEAFLALQARDGHWDNQTRLQGAKSYRLFVEVAGDQSINQYDRDDARKFKDILQRLPADYGKAAAFRGKRLDEIIAIDTMRKDTSQRLTLRTVKRHFSALSSLWQWAIEEKEATENIFKGFSFPSQLRANEQRDMWTEEDLRQLFKTPIYSGCRSSVHRATPGPLLIKDEKYWLPLIAVYSGLRQEEICQLHLEDIRQVDQSWIFDINARPPRKLKNRNAIRKVPIHSKLLDLGLLVYANNLRKGGETMLFPGLRPGGADLRLGHGYSKWFARYRMAVGLYRRGLDFHSFRHTHTTLLQRAGIPIGTIDELTGHATPGETARYSHGLAMQQLVEAIEKIDLIKAGVDSLHRPGLVGRAAGRAPVTMKNLRG